MPGLQSGQLAVGDTEEISTMISNRDKYMLIVILCQKEQNSIQIKPLQLISGCYNVSLRQPDKPWET